MDPRWKDLFPKRGIRLDDIPSNVSSRNNSSSSESDGGDMIRAKDAAKTKLTVAKTKLTVDITQDDDGDDDDGFRRRSDDDGDGHDETSPRLNVARRRRPTRRNIPETAPASLIGSAGKSSSGGSSIASNRKERMHEAQAAVRRWRHGTRITDPASSSRVRVGQGGESLHSGYRVFIGCRTTVRCCVVRCYISPYRIQQLLYGKCLHVARPKIHRWTTG